MPKTGLNSAEWQERLSSFANGNFQFGRGQKPPKGSRWAKVLEAIVQCPKHCNASYVDIQGRQIACQCGYHITPEKVIIT